MNSPHDCDVIGELLGAHALDALDADEAAMVEAHVDSCPRCAQELAEHRETIGLIATSGGPALEGVWDRISGAIGGEKGPAVSPGMPSLLLPGSRRRRRWSTPVMSLAAAAAVAAAVLVGVQTVRVDHLTHQVNQLSAAAKQSGGFQGPAAALLDPSATHLALTSTSGRAQRLGQLVILPSGSAYLVGARLAVLPPTSTYQLWSITAGRAVSVAVLGPHPSTVAFSVDTAAPAAAFLVTVEPAGGVVAPTSSPVARTTE